jgi:hypothetical protein
MNVRTTDPVLTGGSDMRPPTPPFARRIQCVTVDAAIVSLHN